MAETHGTAIEWTHIPGYKGETWNPVTGCTRISPGCDHCYARTLAKRLKAMGQPRYQRDGDGEGFGVTEHPDLLAKPAHWRTPRAVFVNSMSDLFHEEIQPTFVAAVFDAMRTAPDHLFLILTKRPRRAEEWFERWSFAFERFADTAWPLPNVWLGVSIESWRFTWRADVLRRIPAAVRFVSAEPLLESLYPPDRSRRALRLDGIDWLIAGGESGAAHRPLDVGHARELRDACAAANVAFFFKQHGGRTPKAGGRELDGRTWDEYPRLAG